MKIAIRTDASTRIGTGHVMRCLTLADELRARGAEVRFICRMLLGNLVEVIRERGFQTIALPAPSVQMDISPGALAHAAWLETTPEADAHDTIDALAAFGTPDWLITDHYAIDERWERLLRPHVRRVMVIDDLADRHHDCHLLLDQNYYRYLETRYDGLVPPDCRLLLGPKYALLRREFAACRDAVKRPTGGQPRILVMFGGCDLTGETLKTLRALETLSEDVTIDAVVGPRNAHGERIEELCARHDDWHVHRNVTNMAELMAKADISVGAAGTTTWERACMRLPSVIISVAENQHPIGEAAGELGLGIYLGPSDKVAPDDIARAVSRLLGGDVSNMTIDIDGLGAARVCGAMSSVGEEVPR